MNRRRNVLLVLGALVLSFLISTTISLISLNILIDDNRDNMANTYSAEICNQISALFAEPKAVAKAMDSRNVSKILMNKEGYEDNRKEMNIKAYLGDVVKKFGYNTAFIVDANSRKFYSEDGFVRVIDSLDIDTNEWYTNLMATRDEYFFDINKEEGMVYVNCIVHGENNEALGVCGVGIELEELKTILDSFDSQYSMVTKLVTGKGKYQYSCNEAELKTYVNEEIQDMIDKYEAGMLYSYKKTANGHILIKYIDSIDWFVVIDITDNKFNVYDKLVLWNVIGCFIVLTFVILIFNVVVDKINEHSKRIEASEEEQRNIVKAISGIYYSMHLFDFGRGTCTEISSNDLIHKFYTANNSEDIQTTIHTAIRKTTRIEHLPSMLEFTELSSIPERLKGRSIISQEFVGRLIGWSRASFIPVHEDVNGYADKVMFVTQIIEDDKKREEQLIKISKTDELTRTYNRRAYEEDIIEIQKKKLTNDLIMIAIDVNGLKTANDTMGHAAGDELIKGAAYCMVLAFTSYGKVYRTGGDEFMVLMHCEEDKLENIIQRFDESVASWSGEKIKSLAVAKGVVICNQYPECNLEEIEKIADKKMYADKSEYYKRTGIDRRRR